MNLKQIFWCILIFILNCVEVYSFINGITSHNVKSYTAKNKFLMVFINSASCTRCKSVYKNFVAASIPFNGDREIYFGKTTDLKLIKQWGIEELPAIVYLPMGISKPQLMEGEYTVDNLVDTVAEVMKGDFSGLNRVYHLDITEDNYDELIIKPKQHAVLLIYDQYHIEQRNIMRDVAKMFREEDDVVIAVLDADRNKAFRNKKFNFPGAPLLYWFPIDDKYSIKRFGGDLTIDVIYDFINEQTNMWRNKDGTLMRKAGRYSVVDRIIQKNIGNIAKIDTEVMETVIEEVGKFVEKLDSSQYEFGQYYLFLLQKIKNDKDTTFLREETEKIFTRLQDLDIAAKLRDNLIRRHHIIDFIVMTIGEYIVENPDFNEHIMKPVKSKSKVPEHHEL